MSNSDYIDLKRLIVGLAAYYESPMTREQLESWVAVLGDVNLNSLKKITVEMMRDSSITKLPKAAQLREYARLGKILPDDRDAGNEVASRIWESIAKFGPYREIDARASLGELAWEIVQRMGGWFTINQIENGERGTFIAQCRDQAETIQRMARKGILNKPLGIPQQENTAAVKGLIGRATKQLPGEQE